MSFIARAAILVACGLLAPAHGHAPVDPVREDRDLLDRPISSIVIKGLERVPEQKVRNILASAIGGPYDPDVARRDIEIMDALGHFESIEVAAEILDDGSVALVFTCVELPIIEVIDVVGNKLIDDEMLLSVVRLAVGAPRDDSQIERSKRGMVELYRKRGYFLTTVLVEEVFLDEAGLLRFRVIEGPRIRVRSIEFSGHAAFSARELQAEIKTRTSMMFIKRGELDTETLTRDVAVLRRFYRDRGFLDARVDHTVELSPDNTEAKVTFLVEEGQRFTVASIDVGGATVFTPRQVESLIGLRPGDDYLMKQIAEARQTIEDAYGAMGYLDSTVRVRDYRRPEVGSVDLRFEIEEGASARVGLIRISGNTLTRDRVIRRLVGLQPGRSFEKAEIERSRRRILATRLFNDARISVQDEMPGQSGMRDVLVEIKERNTGNVSFGVAVGSDSGMFGNISLRQDNFDVLDTPETLEEFLRGKAFRGAGQRFSLAFQPGDEIFNYSIGLTEPRLLDSDYSLGGGAGFRRRVYNDWTEERTNGTLSLGRQVGDFWTLGASIRLADVDLSDLQDSAPLEIDEDLERSSLSSVGVSLTRSTTSKISRPDSGSRLELSYDRYGALGGDFDLDRIFGEYTVYLLMDRDFLGHVSTLRLRSRIGWFLQDGAPVYERFFLGGRSMRGFDHRSVSPKGTPRSAGGARDIPIGGDWLLSLGAQYEFPLLDESMTGVFFLDTGTVTDDPGFDAYRVSLGGGFRLYIPQFGPTPLAFDFAVPVKKEDFDDSELFSFSVEFPF